jgi:hypothetical protein
VRNIAWHPDCIACPPDEICHALRDKQRSCACLMPIGIVRTTNAFLATTFEDRLVTPLGAFEREHAIFPQTRKKNWSLFKSTIFMAFSCHDS